MRILYFSDIHLEIRQAPSMGAAKELIHSVSPIIGAIRPDDVVVMAGDIGTFVEGRAGQAIEFARQVAQSCKHVILVPGNHEYYLGSFAELRAQATESKIDKVSILDRGEVYVDGVRFIGATLWTDYAVAVPKGIGQLQAMHAAQRFITDHRVIRINGGGPWFMPIDALIQHQASRLWLMEALASPSGARAETVIVTHHGPHPDARNTRHPLDEIAAAFCSDCSDVIQVAEENKARHWIFGHDHAQHDVKVNRVRLLSAQLGYPGEDIGWRGPGVLEI
jgi:predicted phosphohydrolase